MTIDYDPTMDELRGIGERNLEFMELIAKHCAHMKVVQSPFMGRGMAEEMLHMPLNGRTIRCEHARKPGGSAIRLDWIAVEFYRDNCVQCPFREPRGVPNLKMCVDELDQRAASEATARDQARQKQNAEREARRVHRHRLIAGEPYATIEQIMHLDRLDAESADHDAGTQLRTVAQHAPELFTPAAVAVLIETARVIEHPALLSTLRALAHAGRVDARQATGVALETLAHSVMVEAAHFVIDFSEHVNVGALTSALDSLVVIAGRSADGIPHEPAPEPKPLLAALRIAPIHVLERVEAWIASDDDAQASCGAQAAAAIIGVEPGAAPVIASRLLDRLARVRVGLLTRTERRGPLGSITRALTAALLAGPAKVRNLIEQRARCLSRELRDSLFGAFDGVVRRSLRTEGDPALPSDAGLMVVEFSLERLKEDWGTQVSVEAADTLQLIARYHPELLKGRELRVWAAVVEEAQWVKPAPTTLTIAPMEDEDLLESMTATSSHGGRLWRLRSTLDLLLTHEPDAVATTVFALLKEKELRDESILQIRAEAVRVLGPLGCQPRFLRSVIPYLYTALLGTDVRLRATAVDAWVEIRQQVAVHELPAELDALVPVLLGDPYVAVRLRMLKAVGTLGIGDDMIDSAALRVIEVATQKPEAPDAIEDAVGVLQWLASRTKDPQTAIKIRQFCLKFAGQLNDYRLRDFVLRARDDFARYPQYADLLLKALTSELLLDPMDDQARCLELLWHVPPSILGGRVNSVVAAARAHLPHLPYRALRYVEVLQQAGLFTEAANLSDEIVLAIPDTTEFAPRRSHSFAVQAAAHLECETAVGNADGVAYWLARWREALGLYRRARADAER
ncbi:MAG: hypothetical protein HYR72_06230 [Deltaproteobacteria bacterium]|nr:hypothetical protein [Deltaproteobacteria bacterium]